VNDSSVRTLKEIAASFEKHSKEEQEKREAMPENEKQRILDEQRRREETEKRDALIASYRRKGIAPMFYDASWENWISDTEDKLKVLNTVKNEAWKTNLFLCGQSGTGKTRLAMCLVKEGAVYRKLLQIFREVKADFTKEQNIVDFYGSVKLLILDEVGRQGFTPFERTLFWDIIDTRWGNLLPTTLITNLDRKEFTAEYGAAIVDRLRPVMVSFNWESRRGSLNLPPKEEIRNDIEF
jgi:DNA replication protein DnaC